MVSCSICQKLQSHSQPQGRGKERIQNFLQESSSYEEGIDRFILKTQKQLKLDDWGIYLLSKSLATKIYPQKPSTQRLAIWKWLNNLGYDVRIAEVGRGFRLLLPMSHQLYGMSFVKIAGKKYYMDAPTSHKIFTYQQEVTKSRSFKKIHPALTKWSQNRKYIASQEIATSVDSQQHKLLILHDTRTTALMADYPQFAIGFYFSQPLSPLLVQSLRSSFAPLLKYKSPKQQASILLQSIQHGIAYKNR